jgi:CHAT domain-containing protein/tetratricopeptide (TPR) repeat protein
MNNLAELYRLTGAHANAEPLLKRSLEVREAKLGKEHLDVATSLNNLAMLYQNQSQLARAAPLFLRSLAIREAKFGKDHLEVATVQYHLGLLYQAMGQRLEAKGLLERCLATRERKLGKDHPEVATTLIPLAEAWASLGGSFTARNLLKRCLAIREAKLGKDHPDTAEVLGELGGVMVRLGESAAAKPLFERSLAILETKYGKESLQTVDALTAIASLEHQEGQYPRAKARFERVLSTLEKAHGRDHLSLRLPLHWIAVLNANLGRWSEAALAYDRARRITARHVRENLPFLTERQQLEFLVTSYQSEYHSTLSLGLARPGDELIVAKSADWVLNGKAVAQEALGQRYLRSRGQPASPRRGGGPEARDAWVTGNQVQKALAEDAVLVEIVQIKVLNFKPNHGGRWWLGTRYVAWVLPPGRGKIHIVDLGEAGAINRAVERAQQQIKRSVTVIREKGESGAERELTEELQSLAKLVLHPLLPHIGSASRWLISPDASLWVVPWSALPLRDGKYTVEKHDVQFLVSGRDLIRERERVPPGRSVIVADPDFDLPPEKAQPRADLVTGPSPEGAVRGLASSFNLPHANRLPGTAAEARAILPKLERYAAGRPRLYEGNQALKEVVKSLKRPRVLVLSTHGFFASAEEKGPPKPLPPVLSLSDLGPYEHPLLRCGLLLAGCNKRDKGSAKRSQEGVLTGLDVVGCDFRGTELVVLSACETGLGEVRIGEGVSGLRQAFQLAGARAIVATLWQIPDRPSARLMSFFFDNLARKQTKAEALRNAQLTIIKERREDYGAAHPFFWAAFTLTGEP